MRPKAAALSLSCFLFGCSSGSSSDNPADSGTTKPSDGGASASSDGGTPPSDTVAESTRAKCGYNVGSLAADTQGASAPNGETIPIETIVIIMMENRSFDHFFQDLPNQPGWARGDGGTNAPANSVDVAPAGVANSDLEGVSWP